MVEAHLWDQRLVYQTDQDGLEPEVASGRVHLSQQSRRLGSMSRQPPSPSSPMRWLGAMALGLGPSHHSTSIDCVLKQLPTPCITSSLRSHRIQQGSSRTLPARHVSSMACRLAGVDDRVADHNPPRAPQNQRPARFLHSGKTNKTKTLCLLAHFRSHFGVKAV